MTIVHPSSEIRFSTTPGGFQEKQPGRVCSSGDANPVLRTARDVFENTNLVRLNERGIAAAAKYILDRIQSESYSPRSWRTHPLHIVPHESPSWDDPATKNCLDWIFVISSLNFSFWSEREGCPDRYGVEWREGWDFGQTTVHTGYWSLVAAIDRALDENIHVTDPAFYSSTTLCPDSLFEHIFRPAARCSEGIPLLRERIAILREVGRILCNDFGGSFQGFCSEFLSRYEGRGTALQFARMVVETFPPFRDEVMFQNQRVHFWKRAQILTAEIWAAFYPLSPALPHLLFPQGPVISQLTMFSDYRVPQILHHLQILEYSPSLVKSLEEYRNLPVGSKEEVGIRAASIVAVERLREEMVYLQAVDQIFQRKVEISSVLIDFYLWDLAKRIEKGEDSVTGICITKMLPAHRTRGIWY
ncbi:uncharacterized protein FIBRA_03227 [Fibroporia radiculosa]|uniref:Queuosine 5'-phosphate N-glycosylase/hydrolase n=1 Tax=Fibroporia radiculosa TaxID=599839 RepID=J4H2A4_9APHY|nr:uncharacterized protein FIBRA_03227 [Fibroporia radiculosa]CCM01179.1 predicted protein [Fibroporia radiculosa]